MDMFGVPKYSVNTRASFAPTAATVSARASSALAAGGMPGRVARPLGNKAGTSRKAGHEQLRAWGRTAAIARLEEGDVWEFSSVRRGVQAGGQVDPAGTQGGYASGGWEK
jgi:hypothetical protein